MTGIHLPCRVCNRPTCEGTHERTTADTILELRAQVEELTRKGGWVYPHMCRDGHVEIGHADSSSEMCPLCRSEAKLARVVEILEANAVPHFKIREIRKLLSAAARKSEEGR